MIMDPMQVHEILCGKMNVWCLKSGNEINIKPVTHLVSYANLPLHQPVAKLL